MTAADRQSAMLTIMLAHYDSMGITGPMWSPIAATIFDAPDQKTQNMWCLQAFQNQMVTLCDDTDFLYRGCNLPTFNLLAIGS